MSASHITQAGGDLFNGKDEAYMNRTQKDGAQKGKQRVAA